MADSELLQEERNSKFSPKAAYTREIVVFIIVGLIAIKITVIPFLNHLDKLFVESSKSSTEGSGAFLLSERGEGQIVPSIGSSTEAASLNSLNRKYESELVSLKAAHALEIAELKREHIAQLEEVRSTATVSALSLEAKSSELKKCEMLLESERARVDKLIEYQKKPKNRDSIDL